MKKVELEIQILPGGEVICEVKGAPGKACLKYKELLAQILRAEAKSVEHTPEFYAEETRTSGRQELKQRQQKPK